MSEKKIAIKKRPSLCRHKFINWSWPHEFMHRIFMGAEKASEIRARRILRRNFATPSGSLKDVKMLNAKCNTACVCMLHREVVSHYIHVSHCWTSVRLWTGVSRSKPSVSSADLYFFYFVMTHIFCFLVKFVICKV